MRQRGCDADIIQAAIDHGRMILKQGHEFYCVAGKDLPDRMPPAQADRLKNLVVVCREGVVITAYRNGNGFRNVKKKGKRLGGG
jgi:hypothetical protein